MTLAQGTFAPGQRVKICDADWRIRRVDYNAEGVYLLNYGGLFGLVQGNGGLFLTQLDEVDFYTPQHTELVDDSNTNSGVTVPYLDSMLRKMASSGVHIA